MISKIQIYITSKQNYKFQKILLIFCLACIFSLSSCAIYGVPQELVVDSSKPKNIFVFMDGTANNPEIPTNVYRLYQEIYDIGKDKNANTISYYIPGVGNTRAPVSKLLGQGIGFGMEEKILEGYKFITQYYRPGDRIYVFGFSRGAHTARSLAGLISYAGVPRFEDAELNSIWNSGITSGWNIGNKILELTREQIDVNHADNWKNWKRGDAPILAELIKVEIKSILARSKNIVVQPAEIEFLGVWDTVPGSQGIDYFDETDLVCKQRKNSTDTMQRYQIDSYPPIHHIAHAVSIDEKRSQFKPLFLCSKETDKHSVHNEELTKLNEVIFPGAHADVGGGYEHKNNQLPDISLKWMIERLEEHYSSPNLQEFQKNLKPNPKGLADLSISDERGSKFSTCRDRNLPRNITIHDSIITRNNAGAVPWLYFDKKPQGNYAEQSCKDWVDPLVGIKKEKILCIKQSSITCSDLGY
ncbi:DUF2235 domain-containing protein [Nitrosomonas sp.]|uniref:DUF2235 domain-containing protein n=1 Tax=Nitrosomonas sp. TaxID=42353 RepID=UPI002847E044|nr:DUF2235 domain-containing protein [Nitrosomonas sp.]MDR4515472.1 DUF2235 domain-containing protein [Nitrosomonas sp.]